MASIVFFHAQSIQHLPIKWESEYQQLYPGCRIPCQGGWGGLEYGYIRAVATPLSAEDALEKAKPRKGETVLNTVEIN
mgnify:CR=1 FL=1